MWLELLIAWQLTSQREWAGRNIERAGLQRDRGCSVSSELSQKSSVSLVLRSFGCKWVTKPTQMQRGRSWPHFSMVECESHNAEECGVGGTPWSFLEDTVHFNNFLRNTSISLVVPLLFSLSSSLKTSGLKVLNFFNGGRKDSYYFLQTSVPWANTVLRVFSEEKGAICIGFLSPWKWTSCFFIICAFII